MCCVCVFFDQAEPPTTLSLLPHWLTTENWNSLVSAASELFGWQETLAGQSGLLQSDKEIYGKKEMKRESKIVLEVCVCLFGGVVGLTQEVLYCCRLTTLGFPCCYLAALMLEMDDIEMQASTFYKANFASLPSFKSSSWFKRKFTFLSYSHETSSAEVGTDEE